MTYPIFGRGPDGILDIGFGGMLEPYDKVAICSWDHQRQPFLLRDIGDVTDEDIRLAVIRSRGGEVSFIPLSTERSFTIECGSPDQAVQARDLTRPFVFADKSPAYHRVDPRQRQHLRDLLVVAVEEESGLITPFTNKLTHQWYDDSETRNFVEYRQGQFPTRRRLHFFIANSMEAISIKPHEIGV